MKTIWSTTAEVTFIEILSDIEEHFSNKIAQKFYDEVFNTITLIEENPYMFKYYEKHSVRKATIHPNSSMIYEVQKEDNIIRLLTFYDNRMSDEKKKKLTR